MKEVDVTFITGNSKKAEYLSKLLGLKIKHQKVDLDELQSLDLKEIVEHKVRQAYEIVKAPVLVEDVSLEFNSLNGLPGTFIKFFVENLDFKKICNLISDEDRSAVAKCTFGYFDGVEVKFFEGSLVGKISEEARGENGYGWDKIFIPDGYEITRAEMTEEENLQSYLKVKPIEQVKFFLENL
jgi:non-canonical purine NTP pyrophosphatase (RdgB/HAM1 family)